MKNTTYSKKKNSTVARFILTICLFCGAITAITTNGTTVANASDTKAATSETSTDLCVDDEASDDEYIPCKLYAFPNNSNYTGVKSISSYTAITYKDSLQYKLQQMAYTNEDAFRMYDDRYLITLGTYFDAPVGTYIDILLRNGLSIPCIVGDIKDDNVTYMGAYSENGCATGFIVDIEKTKCTGNVSALYSDWDSKPIGIYVYEKNCLI